MESSAWCYYLVPVSLALFSIGTVFFASKAWKKRTGKIELELERLYSLKAQQLEV